MRELIISISSHLLSFKHIISHKVKNIKLKVDNKLYVTKMTRKNR
jgi:hypothetical protein